jgi:hypothetical protein
MHRSYHSSHWTLSAQVFLQHSSRWGPVLTTFIAVTCQHMYSWYVRQLGCSASANSWCAYSAVVISVVTTANLGRVYSTDS